MHVHAIRRDFPALQYCTWFQNGGVSITPAPVASEHARLMRELLERLTTLAAERQRRQR